MISSTANVAMPAASPESRISGMPDDERGDAADDRGQRERRHVADVAMLEEVRRGLA